MNDITRERLWRKLQVLPDDQLYQVLDYIEFLEGKYARGKATEPTGLQRFAERLQDRLRGRSVAPEYISGAVGVLGMARRVVETGRDVVSGVVQTGLGVVDEVVEAGRDLLSEPRSEPPAAASLPAGTTAAEAAPLVTARGAAPREEIAAIEAPGGAPPTAGASPAPTGNATPPPIPGAAPPADDGLPLAGEDGEA